MNPQPSHRRADGWNESSDTMLARIVIDHIRIGSTQLTGFRHAAEKLGRTPGACAFRWNSVVRQNFRAQIEDAKQFRKARPTARRTEPAQPDVETVSSASAMREAITFLRDFEAEHLRIQHENEQLRSERDELLSRVKALEISSGPSSQMGIAPEQLRDDTQALIGIMNRARMMLEK